MVLEMEMSKTYQYRKVMKPMLERKRRARINKCLDELKDIMVECLTQEGEHITRLEKADILELTVEHMKKLKQQKQLKIPNSSAILQEQQKLSIADSFRAGYVHAANEVSKALASVPGVSVELGTQLMSHLGHRLNYLQVVIPTAASASSTTIPPVSINNNTIGSTFSTSNTSSVVSVSTALTTSSPITTYTISTPYPFNGNTTSEYFIENNNNSNNNNNNSNINNNRSTPIIITPPPSECSNSSDRGSSCSPTPSETCNNVWRPW